MAGLLCHLHFWSLQTLFPAIAVGGTIGIHSYQHKGITSNKTNIDSCRKTWAEGRGITWNLPNHKSNKLRDSLRECEELLSSQKIICVKWQSLRHCLVLLESGCLITFTVARHSGDIESLLIDRSLILRLDGSLDKALILDNSIIITYHEDTRVGLIHLSGKKSAGGGSAIPLNISTSDLGRRIEKLSTHDVRVCYPDGKQRICIPDSKVDRHLIANCQKDMIAVWWRDLQEGGWRWSSLAAGGSHNGVIIRIKNEKKLELVGNLQTDQDPVSVCFSKTSSSMLHSLEMVSSPSAYPYVYECALYECGEKKVSRNSVEGSFTTEAPVVVCAWNRDERRLLLACEGGSVVLHDNTSERTLKTKAFFTTITSIQWHPAGSLAVVCGSKGELQFFDLALTPLSIQVADEDPQPPTTLLVLNSYFMNPVLLQHTGWGSEAREGEGHGGCYDNFVAVFNRGPVLLIRFELGVLSRGRIGHVELVAEYLRHKQFYQAVTLLSMIGWKHHPEDSFIALTLIMDHLLSLPLSANTEDLMEAALATFLSVSSSSSSSSCLPSLSSHGSKYTQYQENITQLMRRFFFILLRHRRFEKAFRLAVDIKAKDLFMDIYYMALEHNESALAELAKRKAESLSSGSPATDALQHPLETPPVDVVPEVLANPGAVELSRDLSCNENDHQQDDAVTSPTRTTLWSSNNPIQVVKFDYF